MSLTGGMLLTRDDEVAGAHAAINAAKPTQAEVSDATVRADLERTRCTDSINIPLRVEVVLKVVLWYATAGLRRA